MNVAWGGYGFGVQVEWSHHARHLYYIYLGIGLGRWLEITWDRLRGK